MPRLQSGDEWPSWLTNTSSMSHPVCGTADHAETTHWAARLGTVGLLQVVATPRVATIGRTKHLSDVSGQSVKIQRVLVQRVLGAKNLLRSVLIFGSSRQC
jgi:hypothetical protein